MDTIEQVTKWVEEKVEKIINKDLQDKIVEENSTFDVESYANTLLEKYFNEDDIKYVRGILNPEPHDLPFTDWENSTEEQNTHDSLEFESNELYSFSVEDLLKDLESGSGEIRKKSLKVLEAHVEDLVNHASWDKITKTLQKMINKEDREMGNVILKIFEKPLRCSKKPQIVSKGFTTIVDVIASQIDLFNSVYQTEETYDSKVEFSIHQVSIRPDILIKLMWLLIDCQQHIPVKWVHFNEARFREIIFSFIHLLSSTSASENEQLSGLELLSVLNPKAGWCRYWCHTAVGRSLLCSALRKHKSFFNHITEIILNHMRLKKRKLPPVRDSVRFYRISPEMVHDVKGESKAFPKSVNDGKQKEGKYSTKKTHFSERRKHTSTTPNKNNFSKNVKLKRSKESSAEWIVRGIPRRIVNEAVFFHSISLVSYLIQFRSGRALFPVQTATRKRLLSAQDLSLSITEYLESLTYFEWSNRGINKTSAYETEVLNVLEILKNVKSQMNSSRRSADYISIL